MKRSDALYEAVEERILVLDGAMGTEIQKRGLSEEDFRGGSLEEELREHPSRLFGCNDLLSLTRFDIIYEIYESYIAAGADIITTNTFGANRISLADYGVEGYAYDINLAAAEMARCAVDEAEKLDGKMRFVAGSIGPTNKTASISPKVEDAGFREVSFDDLLQSYTEQVNGLLDGRVDLILIETVFDTLNCKAAIKAVKDVCQERGMLTEHPFPIMVSATISDASGRTLTGQTVEALLVSLDQAELFSIGLNCSMGAEELKPHLQRLAAAAPLPVSAHPNAGLPNQFGDYDQSAGMMKDILQDFMEHKLVNIIGGCCGTTPEHIARIAEIAPQYAPRVYEKPRCDTELSGLEALQITEDVNFIQIGERTNVAGSRRFARLIREEKYDQAIAIARSQVESGAEIIDICMDDAMLDGPSSMRRFLNLIAAEPDISRVPVMVDSSDWQVVLEGLKCLQGKSIVNSISLKEGEEIFLAHAREVRDYGAAMVVMLFDEQGQADTFERKIEIAERSYQLLTEKAGIAPQNIIFDPNVLAVATGMAEHDRYALDFIEAVAWIKENLPYVRISGGVSNLSFSFRGNNTIREAMHSVFLYHAVNNGMDMGIVNPAMLTLYDDIDAELLKIIEDTLLCRVPGASEKLIAYAENLIEDPAAGPQKSPDRQLWRERSPQERLGISVIKGLTGFLEEDVRDSAAAVDDPILLIEGPLMDGMRQVGELFGEGKMFLPQVVKSARVMKQAVGMIRPMIEEHSPDRESSSAGRLLFATVKGDVHDIGKNIVSVVLSCSSIEVIDLGVMVPAERILEAAEEHQVDIIALSGLITPSLQEMINVAQQMEERSMSIPLMVGGAATSAVHTAVKIDPVYSGPVVHTNDASSCVDAAVQMLSEEQRIPFFEKLSSFYEGLREEHRKKTGKLELLDLGIARERGKVFRDALTPNSQEPAVHSVTNIRIPIEDVLRFINWKMFLNTWELPFSSPEAERLIGEAKALLERSAASESYRIIGSVGLFAAGSLEDDVVLETGQGRKTLHFLRQQAADSSCRSLSDLILPVGPEDELRDTIGLFSVSVHVDEAMKEDGYDSLLVQTLADRLTEAASEFLHQKVRRELWGYAPEEELSLGEMIAGRYQGIRPAAGYPACPDHSEKQMILELLGGSERTGIELTASQAMVPNSSVCGYYFAHEQSSYLSVGKIGKDQAADYAGRKNTTYRDVRRWLDHLIIDQQD